MVAGPPRPDGAGIVRGLAQEGKLEFAFVPFEELELLEENARYMRPEVFAQLVENIRRDGGLTSTGFAMLTPAGKYRVLSGNHRAMAGQQAGVERYPLLFTREELSREQQIAIQLSHNAIEGQDDPAILRSLWDQIGQVDLKMYAGLDDATLAELEKVNVPALSEVNLDYQSLTLLFLPDELDRVREVFQAVQAEIDRRRSIAVRMAEWDRLMDAQLEIAAAWNLHNTATIFQLLLDVYERHRPELAEGFMEHEPRPGQKWIPLSIPFGIGSVPPELAKRLHKLVDRLAGENEWSAQERWKALEAMADAADRLRA